MMTTSLQPNCDDDDDDNDDDDDDDDDDDIHSLKMLLATLRTKCHMTSVVLQNKSINILFNKA